VVSVANIGAGTGSYEPSETVVAVEPSRVMLNQRPPAAAPAPPCSANATMPPARARSVRQKVFDGLLNRLDTTAS
jgi:hypothetical protein